MGSQTDLDQGGTFRESSRVYLGPSLGWVQASAPSAWIVPVTTAGTTIIQDGTSLIRVNVNGSVTIQLPKARGNNAGAGPVPGTWVQDIVTVSDTGGFAGAFPITIQPASGDAINGSPSAVINSAYGLATLLSDVQNGGWSLYNAGIPAGGGGDMLKTTYDPTNKNASAFDSTNEDFIQAGTGAITRTSRSKMRDFVSVLDFGADPTGATSSSVAINAAITAVSALGGGSVILPPGTYTLSVAITMRSKVGLIGSPGTIIRQGNAANLVPMINFVTNTANGAAIQGCTIDGNRANNTEGTGTLVSIGTANDVILSSNSFINAPGNAITLTSGLRPKIIGNLFQNINLYGVSIQTGISNLPTAGLFDSNNFNAPIGYHPFGFWNSNRNIISDNHITGSLIGGVSGAMKINTSGSTITWVSGPDFTNVTPGMFLVILGGVEYFIITKTSNTSLTASTTIGANSNIDAVIGTGDMIGIDSSSDNLIVNNYLSGGCANGIVISTASGGADARRNTISRNHLMNTGACSISIQAGGGGLLCAENSIDGNMIYDPAQSGAIAGPSGAYRAGIAIIGGVLTTSIDRNTVVDDQGTKTADYWLGLSSVAAGQVFVGRNTSIGPTNGNIILAGIVSVTPSAGWGTGAAVSLIQSQGNSFYFRVTSGTSPAANPNLVVATAATGSSNITMSKMHSIASGVVLPSIEVSTNTSASKTVAVIGTPAASTGYDVFVVMGS